VLQRNILPVSFNLDLKMEAMSSSNVGEVVPDFTASHPERHSNMSVFLLPPLTTRRLSEGSKYQWH
jgi:hypothetical protein